MTTYEDFSKLDIRIGTIVSAEKVEKSDKLIKFLIDLGEEKRTIVGGFAPGYPDATVLVGTQMPVLVNLEPRTLMGIESQGMVLAATKDDLPVALHPDREVLPGSKIK